MKIREEMEKMWIESSNTAQEIQANLTNAQESQSNNTLTKDSPIFIYVQDLKTNHTNTNTQSYPTKTNFITKLKKEQTIIKIPLDTTSTLKIPFTLPILSLHKHKILFYFLMIQLL